VLLVDDEPLFLTSVEDALRAELDPLEVLRAEDGAAALEIARHQEVDVMVTDLRMPRLDGVELVATLTQIGRFVPTIFVTAHGTPRIEARIRSFGALAILEKPVDLGELVRLVRRRLELPRGGTMQGVSLPGFLQLLAMERKSCTLRAVAGRETGTFVFDRGALVDAQLPHGSGMDAALEMCRWERPVMHVEPSIAPSPTTLALPLEQLLLEAARLQDERSARDPLPPDASRVLDTLPPPPADPSGSLAEPASPINPSKGIDMSNVSQSLEMAMKIEGAVAAALVDYESGLTLGTSGGGPSFNIEAAAAGNTEVVRAKMKVKRSLGIDDAIEDILITLETQYHLIRPIPRLGNLFFYLSIDRERGNLGLARHKLADIEKQLEL
jgi:CheY-like chemotaxis protein